MGTEQAYRMEWRGAPAVEGDHWRSAPRLLCRACGRRYVAAIVGYSTPDDEVAQVDVGLHEPTTDPFMAVPGVVVCRRDVGALLRSAGLSGFELRPATVSLLEGATVERLPPYDWLAVTGRCDVAPIWTEDVGVCDACQQVLERPFTQQQRSVCLRQPLRASVCRARERAAGVLVDEQFRNLCLEAVPDVEGRVTFAPVTVAWEE